jgi:uncharacterized protein YdaU (DUF1376 family)
MSGSSTPFNPKVDVFMPLYIGRYLQDTPHLDALKSGAYLHLLMYFWVRGPLPNDPAELATIAKCTPDAWSMCQASVMHYFELAPDGMLHQRGAERLKDQWIGKRLKAHEKAQNAANVRWSKHKAKKGPNSDAPSIAQAMPEQCPISTYKEQEQKQTPPTPSAAQRGIGPQPVSASSIPGAPSTGPKSKAKAKPSILPITGVHKGTNGARSHPAAKNGVAPGATGGNGHAKSGLHPVGDELRRNEFEREVLSFWKAQNPEHPDYAFTTPDRRALEDLLGREPGLLLPELRRLLRNRAHSEINPAAHPAKWLRNIREYSAGPLGKYGKPRHAARAL